LQPDYNVIMHILHHTFDNSIRLVHHRTDGMVAHCGLIINTGSRDEKENEHGMAHFIEHMLFKGTSRHKAYYILSHLDDVGGELMPLQQRKIPLSMHQFLKMIMKEL
jgi:predicted Zn-dependent peptidase